MSLPKAMSASPYTDHNHPSSMKQRQKRPALDDLDQEQRITKRLHLLDLSARHSNNLWLPANDSIPPTNTIASPVATAPVDLPQHAPSTVSAPASGNEFMDIEDTPHRIYIHDLDAELAGDTSGTHNPTFSPAEAEDNNDRLIFIPDIEKKLNQIPRHVLESGRDREGGGEEMDLALLEGQGQLVLYTVPSSLTVAEEFDGVRKAILESRARARERSRWERERNGRVEVGGGEDVRRTIPEVPHRPTTEDDAMEVDL